MAAYNLMVCEFVLFSDLNFTLMSVNLVTAMPRGKYPESFIRFNFQKGKTIIYPSQFSRLVASETRSCFIAYRMLSLHLLGEKLKNEAFTKLILIMYRIYFRQVSE